MNIWIVMVWSPGTRSEYVGPFPTQEDAAAYADCWTVAENAVRLLTDCSIELEDLRTPSEFFGVLV